MTDGTLGSCKVQYVKLMDGTLDGTTKATVGAGGLAVDLGANNDVTVTGSLTTVSTVTTCSTVTTLSQFGGNAINLGAGAVGTGTLRTTLASDDPAVAKLGTIDADTSGLFACVAGTEVQCDIVGPIPAGTNNIGDVDVLTVPADPFGANADAGSATGSISAKLRFIASTGIPITGTVTIAGAVTNAGTFAVQAAQSGTWTVDLGATDNAVLDAIAASLAGTLTVGSHAVTNAGTFAVQAVCTNAGTFAVQVDGSALTALQLIDDTVYTDDAAFTPGTSKVLGVGFEADEGSTDSVDEGDIGAARMTLDRKQIVTPQPHAAGGLSIFRSLDLDETEEEVKGSAGCIYKVRLTNFSTSIRYVKIYDNTAAGTTVGTTTPIDTIPIPGATSATQPTVITEAYGGIGLTCGTGITFAATTALADADTGAPGANEVVVTVLYK